MTGTATLSPCQRYRYDLTRTWGDEPPLVWIACNPSTADATQLDPTLRRVKAFSEREGAGGLVVLNLFALRSTDPDALNRERDPCGPENLATIRKHLATAATVVCAWGSHKATLRSVVRLRLRDEADALGVQLQCLGKTKSGAPVHPLYQPANAALIPWP